MAKITNQSSLTSKYITPDGQQKNYQTQSNVYMVENMTTSFLKEKDVSKDVVYPKDEVEQTLTLTNNSEYTIKNIVISDNISPGAQFKANSIKIDGVEQPTFDISGFTLPNDLQPGANTKITYTLVIDEAPTASEIRLVSNVEYQVNGENFVEESEQVTIALEKQEVVIQKTSDKTAVVSGQTITFQNDIKNLGNVQNTEVRFSDPIPAGTTFVKGSVEVDGEAKPTFDPQIGFDVGDLGLGKTITIKFKVVVD